MAISADISVSSLIKRKAHDLGFDLCGIASSGNLDEHIPRIKEWCSAGMNADMGYLCRDIEKRVNPGIVFPGAKSVIVTGLNYYTDIKQGGNGIPSISRYAYGVNYQDVIIARLNALLDYIKVIDQKTEGRSFVDSAPLLEKAWGRLAGLGWPGRHSVLINDRIGSFFFLGVIVLNVVLDYDEPYIEDNCGTCRLCIDSCPTGAINENRTINAGKCISYLTIESKTDVSSELLPKLEGRVFGCDRCQEVCPWNKCAKQHTTREFELSDEIRGMTSEDWRNITQENFNRLFQRSAIRRRKYERFMQNVTNVTKCASPYQPESL